MAYSQAGSVTVYDHFWQVRSLDKLAVTLQLTAIVKSANIHNDRKLAKLFWKTKEDTILQTNMKWGY